VLADSWLVCLDSLELPCGAGAVVKTVLALLARLTTTYFGDFVVVGMIALSCVGGNSFYFLIYILPPCGGSVKCF
jgi:uncharacterized membrane-anchored protein